MPSIRRIALLMALLLLAGAGRVLADEAGRWAFDPPRDDFRADALLDLRSLNEKEAGESGFVGIDANGGFVMGNGKPVRFWSINCDIDRDKPFVAKPLGQKTEPDLAHAARFLAKRGVNMVRIGFDINPDGKKAGAKITDINQAQRDWFWRVVAAMKKEGIYTTICPYWSVPFSISKSWNVPGGSDQSALGLLFFDPTLQQAYKAWMKAMLTEKNPYTGIPLAQDPAVAILQIQNEDSLLFWTLNGIKGEQRKNLGTLFANWTKAKYGSLDAAIAKWGGKVADDDLSAGVLGIINIWEMTQPRADNPHSLRLDDETQFLAETDRKFYDEVARYLRKDLGCKQLINASNWRTASPEYLMDSERWSYAGNEVMAINRYYDCLHTGKNNGWAIVNGDEFNTPSVLLNPKPLPVNLKQVHGLPMIVTESAWVLPNDHAAEGPFLVSAYQSLTGVASYYWFATGDDEWTQPQSANGYMPSQRLWTFANPDMLGNFPAAALMFRKGYIQRGQPVVSEQRSMDDLWKRRPPVISEEGSFDPNRDPGNMSPQSSVKTPVNPLAFLCGPVEVTYGGDPAKTVVADLSTLIDEKNKIVRSNTGQLELNYYKGYCTLDSPKAQGVAAFFKNQQHFHLTDISIDCKNDYAVVLAVSMDDQPLRTSKKILIQVGTQCRPTGWKQSPTKIMVPEGQFDGFRVDDFGHAPWQVVSPDVSITFPGTLRQATTLDMNGNPTAKRTGIVVGGAALSIYSIVSFPKNAMYVIVEY